MDGLDGWIGEGGSLSFFTSDEVFILFYPSSGDDDEES